MRITGWRVDGYGVLSEHRVDDLPAGLSVVHGPNEAGKSTLLDFVRNVLFGFPDRRHARPMREPLRGGRHGGALFLADGAGRRWTIERHAGARVIVTSPEGTISGDAELKSLLGGIDATVFASVFAFDLDELASLKSLERDEVRELVFSAGVLGAGRSATRALRALSDRQALLVRPRQQDAVANRLRRRVDEIDTELRALKADAARYPARASECARLRDEARASLRDAEGIRERRRALELLDACWPVWVTREAALGELASMVEPDTRMSALLALAGDVDRLARDGSGHEQRVESARAQGARLDAVGRALDGALVALGPDIGVERALATAVGDAARSRVAELARRDPELRAQLGVAGDDLERSTKDLRSTREARERAAASGAPGVDAGELDRRVQDLQELGELVGERDEALARCAAVDHAEQLARLAAHRSGHESTLAPAIAVALVALAMATGVAAVVARERGTLLAAALGGVALALVLLAVVVLRASSSPAARGDAPSADRDGPVPIGADLERLAGRIAALASSAGIAGAPSAAEVAAAARRTAFAHSQRQRLDELDGAVAEAQRRVGQAASRLERLSEEARRGAQEIAALARSVGVTGTLESATALDRSFATLDEIARLARERDELLETLAPLSGAIRAYEAEVDAIVAALPCGADPREVTGSGEGAAAVVRALEAELTAVALAEMQRAALRRALVDADAEITRSLGAGVHADALRDELSHGDVVGWRSELGTLSEVLEDAMRRHEGLVRASRDAERTLEELERSDTIAALEVEREGCAADLAATLEQYVVAGIARHLLEQALRRYERERQPAVVARAATLFRSVTGGRYVELVARADQESGRSQGVSAISATGAVIDAAALSRGTAEQLYLCLRLALASSFASGSTALPVVLDDVLVNFDPQRASAVARAVAEVSSSHQVLAFTCHPHIVDLLRDAAPSARVVDLPDSG
ncbi:MAG TPA: AAA family ATPase [Acidimicrobiales bacterium]|nr:AAA family ATPase [Acidimicrobiales bacterium]